MSVATRPLQTSPVVTGPPARAWRAPEFARRARYERWRRELVAPIAAGVLTTVSTRGEHPIDEGLIVAVVLGWLARMLGPQLQHARLCPALRAVHALLLPLVAAVAIVTLQLTTGMPDLSARSLAEIVVCVLVLAHPSGARPDIPPVRTAFVGTPEATRRWERSLAESCVGRFLMLGTVAVDGSAVTPSTLGHLDELGGLVSRESIDLLVVGDGAPLLRVLERLSWTSLTLPVRVVEASRFCEDMLGQVPVTEIDAAWFAGFLEPEAPIQTVVIKRAMDIVVALIVGVLTLPLMGLLMLMVRRRDAPALFKQTRIGEGGQPFTLYKLRTMRPGATAEWASDHDPRITRLGRRLRASHLDELPQLFNILRGDMSLVGPRPEQPAYVAELERALPFYDRRHLMRPGLTGWAQLRCGYSGTPQGAARKLCHDLYYARHRSTGFDLLILAETAAELIAPRSRRAL
jgi:lipopolysaccharide/colanic/teichoic acid biosynthesis glycosyltransferase